MQDDVNDKKNQKNQKQSNPCILPILHRQNTNIRHSNLQLWIKFKTLKRKSVNGVMENKRYIGGENHKALNVR